MNFRNLNHFRAANSIDQINYVLSKICHIMDTHFCWNCSNIRCKNCLQATIYCPVRLVCQWNGSLNHSFNERLLMNYSVKQALKEHSSDVDDLATYQWNLPQTKKKTSTIHQKKNYIERRR